MSNSDNSLLNWLNLFQCDENISKYNDKITHWYQLSDGIIFTFILSHVSNELFDVDALHHDSDASIIVKKSNLTKLVNQIDKLLISTQSVSSNFAINDIISIQNIAEMNNIDSSTEDSHRDMIILIEIIFTITIICSKKELMDYVRSMGKEHQTELRSLTKRIMSTYRINKIDLSSQQLNKVTHTIQSSTNESELYPVETSNFNHKIIDENKNLNQLNEELQSKLSILQAELDEALSDKNNVEAKYLKMIEEQVSYQQSTNNQNLTKDFDQLQIDYEKIQFKVETLISENNKIHTLYEVEQENNTSYIENLSNMESELTQQKKSNLIVQNELSILKDKYDMILKLNEKINENISVLRDDKNELSINILHLEEEIIKKNDIIDKLQSENVDFSEQIPSLFQQILDLEQSVKVPNESFINNLESSPHIQMTIENKDTTTEHSIISEHMLIDTTEHENNLSSFEDQIFPILKQCYLILTFTEWKTDNSMPSFINISNDILTNLKDLTDKYKQSESISKQYIDEIKLLKDKIQDIPEDRTVTLDQSTKNDQLPDLSKIQDLEEQIINLKEKHDKVNKSLVSSLYDCGHNYLKLKQHQIVSKSFQMPVLIHPGPVDRSFKSESSYISQIHHKLEQELLLAVIHKDRSHNKLSNLSDSY